MLLLAIRAITLDKAANKSEGLNGISFVNTWVQRSEVSRLWRMGVKQRPVPEAAISASICGVLVDDVLNYQPSDGGRICVDEKLDEEDLDL